MKSKVRLVNNSIAKLSSRRVAYPQKQVEAHYRVPEFLEWAKAVKKRAGYRCENCGRTDTRMFADHIREAKDNMNLFLDLSNGQCLCGSCHTIKTFKEKGLREKRKMKTGGYL